jgi:hypothetical protein
MAETPEVAAVRALVAYLRARYGPDCVLLHVHLDLETAHLKMGVDMDPAGLLLRQGQEALAPSQGEADPHERTETEQAILDVLAECARPLKGEAVARRGGRRFNAHFSKVLAQLVRSGEVLKTGDGYWLADRAEPNETTD